MNNPPDLITKNSDGSLTVNSLVVAEEFGRPHGKVLRSIDSVNSKLVERGQAAIGSSNYIDLQGKTQRSFVLTEEQFLVVMPFIGGNKSFDGQIRLVKEFIRLREQQTTKNRHIDAIRSLLLLDAPSKWEKLYPDNFFVALMNLHGHEFNGNKSTPSYCAAIIRRWIYEIVLPVELLHETNTCRGAVKRHCWFTKDNGRSTLLSQIAKVEMVARMSQSRADFESNCARSFLDAPLQLNVF
jgi:Rha family phage regulatory protein